MDVNDDPQQTTSVGTSSNGCDSNSEDGDLRLNLRYSTSPVSHFSYYNFQQFHLQAANDTVLKVLLFLLQICISSL